MSSTPENREAKKGDRSLKEQIDDEVETIMYTCAPQSVKDHARKRLKILRDRLWDESQGGSVDGTDAEP